MVSPTAFQQKSEKTPEDVKYQPLYLDTVESTSEEESKWVVVFNKVILCFSMGIALFTVLLVLQYAVEECYQNLENQKYLEMFNEFILKFDRKYDNPEELSYRFYVFRKTVEEFEEIERRNPGLDLDITQFADWTDDELRQYLRSTVNPPEGEMATRFSDKLFKNGESRPASVDWRSQGKLTPIKNQGQCGSCWAFATVAAVEAQYAIKKGSLVSLSEQEMVDCDHRNNGCHGGYRPYAMNFVKKNGLEKEQEYPYTGLEGEQCHLRQNDTRVFIDDYKMLSQNEDEIADWVAANGPVTFGMNVIKSMYNYRSGVFNPSEQDCQEKSMGSHALIIVGYGTEGTQDYWIVKNSWGTYWGDNGYFRLARGVNSCGAANTVVAPVIN